MFLGSNWCQQFVQWGDLPNLQTIVLHIWLLSMDKFHIILPMRRFPISILKDTIFGVLLRFLRSNWGQQFVQWGRSAKIANYCSSLLHIWLYQEPNLKMSCNLSTQKQFLKKITGDPWSLVIIKVKTNVVYRRGKVVVFLQNVNSSTTGNTHSSQIPIL